MLTYKKRKYVLLQIKWYIFFNIPVTILVKHRLFYNKKIQTCLFHMILTLYLRHLNSLISSKNNDMPRSLPMSSRTFTIIFQSNVLIFIV